MFTGVFLFFPFVLSCNFFSNLSFGVVLSLQNEARKLNHQEVVEEDKRLKLPSNWEAKKARLEWELAEDQKKKVLEFFSSPGLVHWMY